jgi:dihydropteroate synthase
MLLDCNGKPLDLSSPKVMGVLNLAPDSFYDGGKFSTPTGRLARVEQMLAEGAAIIDIGAVSSRPGARGISESGELKRLIPPLKHIRKQFPQAILSVDTCRPLVAERAAAEGADMINDIYGGTFDATMPAVIARLGIPCILMHMQGTPGTMQNQPQYGNVVAEISAFLLRQIRTYHGFGFNRLLIDPGFGFGKTIAHNLEILKNLKSFHFLGYPVVAGLSRKSMIQKILGVSAQEALNGTTVLHTIALLNGASILRVHDVKDAVQAVRLVADYLG